MKRNRILWVGVGLLFIGVLCLMVHLFVTKTYHSYIHVTLSKSNIPVVLTEIEGEKYPLGIDLGSKFSLSLNKPILEKLEKTPHSPIQVRDVFGKTYESKAYSIHKIKIGNLSFNNVTVKEISEDFVKNTTLWDGAEKLPDRCGTIGRALLGKSNLLLDVKNSSLFVSNDIRKLKKSGYDLKELTKASFEAGRAGIVLPVDTDVGVLRLAIDTGSTFSVIRSSLLQDKEVNKKVQGFLVYTTSKFTLGDKDFGAVNLYLLDVTPELHEIDGLLGMNFLKTHVLYIDYEKGMVYVGDSVGLSP